MRVLVTGASGFLGAPAVAALRARGCEVVAVSRRPASVAPGVTCREADLLAPGVAENVVAGARADALLHLAWCVTPGLFWTDPANLDWVAASRRLLQAAAQAGTRRIVFVGTCYEYDWPTDADCRERATPITAHTLYDVAKDILHRMAAAFAAEAGLCFAWARLFHLYGPGEKENRLVPQLCRALARGNPAVTSSGALLRDFMDVRDAGAALAALLVSEVSGPVNIASGEAVTIGDLAIRLADLAGRPDLALPGHGAPAGEPRRVTADVGRLRHEVGAPLPRPLDQGLAEALAFWRQRANSEG